VSGLLGKIFLLLTRFSAPSFPSCVTGAGQQIYATTMHNRRKERTRGGEFGRRRGTHVEGRGVEERVEKVLNCLGKLPEELGGGCAGVRARE